MVLIYVAQDSGATLPRFLIRMWNGSAQTAGRQELRQTSAERVVIEQDSPLVVQEGRSGSGEESHVLDPISPKTKTRADATLTATVGEPQKTSAARKVCIQVSHFSVLIVVNTSIRVVVERDLPRISAMGLWYRSNASIRVLTHKRSKTCD